MDGEDQSVSEAPPRPHRRGALLRRSGRRPAGRGQGRAARAGRPSSTSSPCRARWRFRQPSPWPRRPAAFPTAPRYDGYVALGCVIRGETYHFEIVSDQSAAGIMALGIKGVAIGNGILTVEDEDQAWARARCQRRRQGRRRGPGVPGPDCVEEAIAPRARRMTEPNSIQAVLAQLAEAEKQRRPSPI